MRDLPDMPMRISKIAGITAPVSRLRLLQDGGSGRHRGGANAVSTSACER